jgi:molecular chaperone HscB
MAEALVPPAAGPDLFAVLGLPRSLVVDPAELERRYHAASAAVHPDRHQAGGPRARELAGTVSAEVNRAYRTLRDPVALGRYWLELHGERLGANNEAVPAALAALVFATQEQLDELRAARGAALDEQRRAVAATRDELASRLARLEDALCRRFREWDDGGTAAAPAALAEIKERLSEMAYLGTLLGDVEEALEA